MTVMDRLGKVTASQELLKVRKAVTGIRILLEHTPLTAPLDRKPILAKSLES